MSVSVADDDDVAKANMSSGFMENSNTALISCSISNMVAGLCVLKLLLQFPVLFSQLVFFLRCVWPVAHTHENFFLWG